MSYTTYIKAMELAQKCKFYTTENGKTDETIISSEKKLGLSFSRQCRDFYSNYGYLSFGGNEIFGIDPDDDSGILEGNSVAYALNDRKEYKLPIYWIPIYNFNDGNMAYLDYSKLNDENEPRVIEAYYDGNKYVIVNVVAEDFGDFVYHLVQEQI